jgi:hypothetical protein
MNALKVVSFLSKYGPMAIQAVTQVQAEVGGSNGDPAIQQTKKQLAVSYVLAAAHAGESVPVGTVQQVAVVVDTMATLAKALGLFGKSGSTTAPVTVPTADQQKLPL